MNITHLQRSLPFGLPQFQNFWSFTVLQIPDFTAFRKFSAARISALPHFLDMATILIFRKFLPLMTLLALLDFLSLWGSVNLDATHESDQIGQTSAQQQHGFLMAQIGTHRSLSDRTGRLYNSIIQRKGSVSDHIMRNAPTCSRQDLYRITSCTRAYIRNVISRALRICIGSVAISFFKVCRST